MIYFYDPDENCGKVKIIEYRQRCRKKKCVEQFHRDPKWAPGTLQDVLCACDHFIIKIKEMFYGGDGYDISWNSGKETKPHDSRNCEGCLLGRCVVGKNKWKEHIGKPRTKLYYKGERLELVKRLVRGVEQIPWRLDMICYSMKKQKQKNPRRRRRQAR